MPYQRGAYRHIKPLRAYLHSLKHAYIKRFAIFHIVVERFLASTPKLIIVTYTQRFYMQVRVQYLRHKLSRRELCYLHIKGQHHHVINSKSLKQLYLLVERCNQLSLEIRHKQLLRQLIKRYHHRLVAMLTSLVHHLPDNLSVPGMHTIENTYRSCTFGPYLCTVYIV